MNTNVTIADITFHISLQELCLNQNISRESIVQMVEYEIVVPLSSKPEQRWSFDTQSMHWITKAAQLNRQLEIDWVATAMIIKLLKTQKELEQENLQLKAILDRKLLY